MENIKIKYTREVAKDINGKLIPGERIYPVTSSKGVITGDTTLDTKLKQIDAGITSIGEGVTNVGNLAGQAMGTATAAQQSVNVVGQRADLAVALAQGKPSSVVFDTLEEVEDWISNPANVGKLKIGDNIYIKDTNTPDYWVVDALTISLGGHFYVLQALETEKVDLSNYATHNELGETAASLGQSISQALSAANTKVSDVKVNGTSVVENGVADIPLIKNVKDSVGLVKMNLAGGIRTNDLGLYLDTPTESELSQKKTVNAPLKPSHIDKIVKYGITTNTLPLTEEEQTAAKNWLGINVEKVNDLSNFYKEGVIKQKQNWVEEGTHKYSYYTMSNIERGYISVDFINRMSRLKVNFNEETGYFELNGLTDISFEEMQDIYNYTYPLIMIADNITINGIFLGNKARTNIPFLAELTDYWNTRLGHVSTSMSGAFRETDFEVARLPYNNYYNNISKEILFSPTLINYSFYNQFRLHTVLNPLNMANIKSQPTGFFDNNCYKKFYLKNVICSLSFTVCDLLEAECIHYMITNAANTTAITLAFHTDAKARWETSEYYEEDSQTILTKNITIA